ncbi:MAG: hypothetical protein WAV26_10960, partial [Candidatus Deferrimicrobium sp.]
FPNSRRRLRRVTEPGRGHPARRPGRPRRPGTVVCVVRPYVANTAAAAATRELCGRGVDLRPGSKIRYLLADRGGRAMGFLDGTETPDVPRYEEMLREAGEELMGIVACSR